MAGQALSFGYGLVQVRMLAGIIMALGTQRLSFLPEHLGPGTGVGTVTRSAFACLHRLVPLPCTVGCEAIVTLCTQGSARTACGVGARRGLMAGRAVAIGKRRVLMFLDQPRRIRGVRIVAVETIRAAHVRTLVLHYKGGP